MDWNRHQRGQIDVGTDHIKTRESPDGWRRNLGSFFEFAFGHFLGLSNLGLGSEFVKVGVQKWQFPETSKKCQFDVFFAIWPNSGFRVKFDQILGSMDPCEGPQIPNHVTFACTSHVLWKLSKPDTWQVRSQTTIDLKYLTDLSWFCKTQLQYAWIALREFSIDLIEHQRSLNSLLSDVVVKLGYPCWHYSLMTTRQVRKLLGTVWKMYEKTWK